MSQVLKKPKNKKGEENSDIREIQPKRVRRTKEELKDVYIDPIEMEALIEEYYQSEINLISDRLAEMIQLIAVRLALARNFYSYSFKTEMQGDAIVKMITALRRKRFKCGAWV